MSHRLSAKNWCLSLAILSLVLLAGLTAALAAEPPAVTAQSGTGSVGAPRKVVMRDIPQITVTEALGQEVPRPRAGVSEEVYRARKERAATEVSAFFQPDGEAMAAPAFPDSALQTPGATVSFNGIKNRNSLSPSDMALAVGKYFAVQVVNSSIAVYDKTGVMQPGFPKSLNPFLGAPAGHLLFDPRIIYDQQNKRFFLVVDESIDDTQSSNFYVAVTATGDPRGAWWIYHHTYGGADDFGDFPTLGQDAEAIYFCFNTFSNASDNFVGNVCFIWPKAPMYVGGGFSFSYLHGINMGGTLLDCIQPVNSYGNPRAEFLLASYNILWGGGQCSGGCSGVVLMAISNPIGTMGAPSHVFSGGGVATSGYSLPPNADAPGCANCVDTNDTRISGTVSYRAGSLFAGINTAVNNGSQNVSAIRWFEVVPTLNDNGGGCSGVGDNNCATISGATLRQDGLYYYSGSSSAYYPTIQPDPEKNLMMVFEYSNGGTVPAPVYASRRVTQAANSFHDSGTFLWGGSGSVTTGVRWGDYTGVSIDPAGLRPRSWFSGQYNSGTNNWKTRIGAAGYANPGQP